jgi:hypothetical protein
MASRLRGAQHLIGEALGLARSRAVDASRPEAKILAAAAHWREPKYRTVPQISLKSLILCFRAARDPTHRHGERQGPSRTWMATGEPLLSRRLNRVAVSVRFSHIELGVRWWSISGSFVHWRISGGIETFPEHSSAGVVVGPH